MKAHPQLSKCYVGLIHSHHNMGAYHSGTDDDTLIDLAPANGFYGSLVVSHTKENYAFAISYKSQYQHGIIIESENIILDKPVLKISKEFETVVNNLKKQEESNTKQQVALWNDTAPYYNHPNASGSYYTSVKGGLKSQIQDNLFSITDEFIAGDINVHQARAKFRVMNEDFDSFFLEYYDETVQTNKKGEYLDVATINREY
tara:strand:+ start:7750 stop:8355 length:606 start_codon:yes stop_codon:yes gene_type:complete